MIASRRRPDDTSQRMQYDARGHLQSKDAAVRRHHRRRDDQRTIILRRNESFSVCWDTYLYPESSFVQRSLPVADQTIRHNACNTMHEATCKARMLLCAGIIAAETTNGPTS